MGVAITLADIAKRGLLGTGSGSSGGGSGGGGSSGGGSVAVSPKEVNFYDYDGTCVYAYSVAEAQALSELPAGPEHPGLVFQGWNWSLEGVKGLTRAMNIGAMYTTDDGTTRLYITLQEGRTSPMLGVGVNGTVTVDWGDGTEPDVLTGTNIAAAYTKWTPNHDYAAPGDYVIRLTVEGEMQFNGHSSQGAYVIRCASGSDTRNRAYNNALRRVEIGENVRGFYSYAFKDCNLLKSVTFPKDTTDFGTSVFDSCHSLKSVTIPNGVTRVYGSTFNYCNLLTSVAIPEGTTQIDTSAFGLCFSIESMTIPGSVTNIAGTAFMRCVNMICYDFTACTAVPTLAATSAFTDIPADCEIRVPATLYDEWIAATNWATYASQIKAY